MKAFSAEIGIVVAYGKLLPANLLKTPQHGFVNVHFSLLPAYRGAAPIQRALMKGEKKTGVSLFWLDEGMDTGPLFLQRELPVQDDDDGESLRQKLIPLGVQALEEMLSQLGQGKITRTPQQGVSSLAPSLKKEEGQIDWARSADDIANLVRGTYPWPGAFTFVILGGKKHRLKILQTRPEGDEKEGTAGEVIRLESGKGFVVRCGRGSLHILKVQPEGKRPMAAWDFWQGARLKLGEKLG
jgi:methionyl-tRNA formyltransferase